MDLLRRRRRYSEPEARYILVQLISACQYMHQTNVIHRDLKLGNLFLDASMDIKVGDFGLAALIEKPGDRKKYIAGQTAGKSIRDRADE
jgi:serine/threonine protein kinase